VVEGRWWLTTQTLLCCTQVRFFERRKIERHIAKLLKKQSDGGGKLAPAQQAALDKWQNDLQVSSTL
jgi:hypothetical protein